MDPVRTASEQAAALGGPRINPGEPRSQLGGPQSQLREPRSQLGGPQSQVGGPGGRGGRRKKRDRQNGAFLVCGGTIGHRPLRGRCPKTVWSDKRRTRRKWRNGEKTKSWRRFWFGTRTPSESREWLRGEAWRLVADLRLQSSDAILRGCKKRSAAAGVSSSCPHGNKKSDILP